MCLMLVYTSPLLDSVVGDDRAPDILQVSIFDDLQERRPGGWGGWSSFMPVMGVFVLRYVCMLKCDAASSH